MISWLPSLKFGGSSTGITYSLQKGYCEQWQDEVWYIINITLSSKGTATGNATITGLPISYGTANLMYPTVNAYIVNGSSVGSNQTFVAVLQSDTLTLYAYNTSNGVNNNLTNSLFNNNTSLSIWGSYMVI